jgi:hypothetical protein
MSNIRNIFKSIKNKDKKLTILLLHFDQDYETLLAQTGHNFYVLTNQENQWSDETRIPENFYLLKGNLTNAFSFDIIISSGRFTQSVSMANQVKSRFRIPYIIYENNTPWSFNPEFKCIEDIPKRYMDMLKQTSGNINIFSSDEIEKSWSNITTNNTVVPYGKGLEDKFLSEWEDILTKCKEIK